MTEEDADTEEEDAIREKVADMLDAVASAASVGLDIQETGHEL
jgi:hypothetical protein